MKKRNFSQKIFFPITILLLSFLSSPIFADAIGFSVGFGDIKSKKDGRRFSDFTPITVYYMLNNESKWPIEVGFSQLADITYTGNVVKEKLSLMAPFVAVRRMFLVQESYFTYVKFGAAYWIGEYKQNEIGATAGDDAREVFSTKGKGLTAIIGAGVDILIDRDLGMRLEYEHIPDLADGIYDNNPTTNQTHIDSGYNYNRINVGVVVAF